MRVQGKHGGAALAALACLLFSGCSFHREWKAAQNCCYPGDPLAGAWEGTWESHSNGHHGTLRAIFTPCGPNTYRARYHATFLGCIPYGYETTHTTADACGAKYFCGKVDLGYCAGGEYSYWGLANGSAYEAGYRTEKDEGVYQMTRVGRCCGQASCRVVTPSASASPDAIEETPAPSASPAEAPSVLPSPPPAAPGTAPATAPAVLPEQKIVPQKSAEAPSATPEASVKEERSGVVGASAVSPSASTVPSGPLEAPGVVSLSGPALPH